MKATREMRLQHLVESIVDNEMIACVNYPDCADPDEPLPYPEWCEICRWLEKAEEILKQ